MHERIEKLKALVREKDAVAFAAFKAGTEAALAEGTTAAQLYDLKKAGLVALDELHTVGHYLAGALAGPLGEGKEKEEILMMASFMGPCLAADLAVAGAVGDEVDEKRKVDFPHLWDERAKEVSAMVIDVIEMTDEDKAALEANNTALREKLEAEFPHD